jgi:hypothetical protein
MKLAATLCLTMMHINGAVGRGNTTVKVLVNGTEVTGAQVKSHYIRNQSGHTNSSGSLVYLLENLSANDIISVTSVQEAGAGTLDDTTPALLMVWQKTQLNERPASPTLYDAPFNNIRFASTTPYFDFSAADPDGTSDIQYQFSISTTSGFTASTTRDFRNRFRDFLILLPALIPRHLLKVIKFVFNYNLLMHLQISKLIIGGCERVTLVVQMNMVNGLLLRA